MDVLRQQEPNTITKADIIFLAILLVYGNHSLQPISIKIPINGEITNNRQCENRILFIEYVILFIYNYIHHTYLDAEYVISITPDNKIAFTCSSKLSSEITNIFNLTHLKSISWLLKLPRANKQVFIKYLLVFMCFSSSRKVFYSSREDKLTVDIIYKLIFEYYDSLRCLADLIDPMNIGASNYGFKLDIYKIVNNNLIKNLLNVSTIRTGLLAQVPTYKDHLEYALNYINYTYDNYRVTVLDNPDYEPEPDVFI